MGTDYPFPWTKTAVDHILARPGLSDDERIAMLGGTAAKLLGIKPTYWSEVIRAVRIEPRQKLGKNPKSEEIPQNARIRRFSPYLPYHFVSRRYVMASMQREWHRLFPVEAGYGADRGWDFDNRNESRPRRIESAASGAFREKIMQGLPPPLVMYRLKNLCHICGLGPSITRGMWVEHRQRPAR